MDIIKQNTVPAENQMANSSEVSFLGNKDAKMRILVVGNSITRHGPCEEIGWYGDWGMAASTSEKDFVHRLYAKIKDGGKDAYMCIRQCAFWERNYLLDNILNNYNDEKKFNAGVIIFRLGENVEEKNKPFFEESAGKFIGYLKGAKTKVIFTTCFWKNKVVDDAIRDISNKNNYSCIELGDLGDDSEMRATGQFEHSGVAAHPSDKGMENIAERIYGHLRDYL